MIISISKNCSHGGKSLKIMTYVQFISDSHTSMELDCLLTNIFASLTNLILQSRNSLFSILRPFFKRRHTPRRSLPCVIPRRLLAPMLFPTRSPCTCAPVFTPRRSPLRMGHTLRAAGWHLGNFTFSFSRDNHACIQYRWSKQKPEA